MTTTSGLIVFGDYRTWYQITGDEPESGTTPLVILHGGPGGTHDYLGRLVSLARDGRAVVFYDQIGNGWSTHLPDAPPESWTVEFFLAELENLLVTLGIAGNYALLGHSWGGMLAAEHAVLRPAGLRSLVLSNAPASMPLWIAATDQLRAALPTEVECVLRAHERAGTTASAAYQNAVMVFTARHICRVMPMPADIATAPRAIASDPTVYHAMNGPSDFHVIGSLRGWSIVDRVGAIAVPTLVITGRHDEATPDTVRPFVDGIPNVRWELFPESSHLPFAEEPHRYDRIVGDFLNTVEAV